MSVSRETSVSSRRKHNGIKAAATRKRVNDRRLTDLQAAARTLADAALLAEICLHPQARLMNYHQDTATARGNLHSARTVILTMLPVRTCIGCGCTDNNACMTPSGPCYWAGPELCSKCAAEGRYAA